MEGQLNELEPHPAAEGARQWLIGYIQRKDAYALLRLQESFASCGLEGNRLAEICCETLRRLLNKEPVSDRYLLGLVWTIRDMEEKELAESRDDGLTKELAHALVAMLAKYDFADQLPADHPVVAARTVIKKAKAAGLV